MHGAFVVVDAIIRLMGVPNFFPQIAAVLCLFVSLVFLVGSISKDNARTLSLFGYAMLASMALFAHSQTTYVLAFALIATSFTNPQFIVALVEQVTRNKKTKHFVYEYLRPDEIEKKVREEIGSSESDCLSEQVRSEASSAGGAGVAGEMKSDVAEESVESDREEHCVRLDPHFYANAAALERASIRAVSEKLGIKYMENVRLANGNTSAEFDGVSESENMRSVLEVKLIFRPMEYYRYRHKIKTVSDHFLKYSRITGQRASRYVLAFMMTNAKYSNDIDMEALVAETRNAECPMELIILTPEDVGKSQADMDALFPRGE